MEEQVVSQLFGKGDETVEKRIALVSLVLVLAMSLVAVGCPLPVVDPEVPVVEPIRLGAVNPLGDITGYQSTQGMRLAVKEINAAGGVLGRPLELIVLDSELKPAVGAAAIEKLAEVHEVDFFIGGMSSAVHFAQIPILKEYEKITVWIGAAAGIIEQAIGPVEWYFHLHPWDYLQGESVIRGWAEIAERFPQIRLDRQFIAYEEGAFGTASMAAFKALVEDTGIEMTGDSFVSAAFGGGDFRAVLGHAKEFDPDVFVWIGFDPDAKGISMQSKEIGFAPPIFLGSPPGWPVGFEEIVPLSHAMFLYAMWAEPMNEVLEVARDFWYAFIEMWDEEPVTYFAPLGWVNVHFLARGIEKAGTIEREPLIRALAAIEMETPLGPLSIGPSRITPHQGFTAQMILQFQYGETEIIWPFEFATAEPIWPFPCWGDPDRP